MPIPPPSERPDLYDFFDFADREPGWQYNGGRDRGPCPDYMMARLKVVARQRQAFLAALAADDPEASAEAHRRWG